MKIFSLFVFMYESQCSRKFPSSSKTKYAGRKKKRMKSNLIPKNTKCKWCVPNVSLFIQTNKQTDHTVQSIKSLCVFFEPFICFCFCFLLFFFSFLPSFAEFPVIFHTLQCSLSFNVFYTNTKFHKSA